jgi:hypothetical protein
LGALIAHLFGSAFVVSGQHIWQKTPPKIAQSFSSQVLAFILAENGLAIMAKDKKARFVR